MTNLREVKIKIDALSDIHIKQNQPKNSIAYRDGAPYQVEEGELTLVMELLEKINGIDRADFMVENNGMFWRGRKDKQAVDGTWFRLRKMQSKPPSLNTLPLPMAAPYKAILMSQHLRGGGLIHIAGAPGSGKTTTASAIVVSRLMEYGGVAYSVEDPPELPLNGWHGKGYCTQTWVAGDNATDWTESMRGVLRSQPTGTSVILYVGEIRDADTARAMLRAASNGFLVISTGFGSDIITSIDSFFQLVGREYAASIAAILRVVVHQKIENERFMVDMLTCDNSTPQVANIIRSGQLAQLANEVLYQRNQIRSQMSLPGRL